MASVVSVGMMLAANEVGPPSERPPSGLPSSACHVEPFGSTTSAP